MLALAFCAFTFSQLALLVMLRAARLSSIPATSRSSIVIFNVKRGYAVSVHPPRVWPGKSEARVFNERKTYLYNQFTSLLNRGSSQPLLFLHHKNFKASGMIKLRREVSVAALPKGTAFSLLDTPPHPDTLPHLAVIRSSVFGVALRHHAPLDEKAIADIGKMADGGCLAVVSLPSLEPPVLQAILRAMERAVPHRKKIEQPANAGKAKSDENEGFVPGRRMKRHKPILVPELSVVGALIEGRVFGVEQVKDVSKLPSLETLRQQIVGLISSPAMQLAMVLGEANGGRLARTLEGLKKALEEEQASKVETVGSP